MRIGLTKKKQINGNNTALYDIKTLYSGLAISSVKPIFNVACTVLGSITIPCRALYTR